MQKIELVNEEGQIETWYMHSTFGMDDTTYAALMQDEDDDEVVLMRVNFMEDGNAELSIIEDEEELEDAFAIFVELEEEEEEKLEDGEDE